MRSDVISMFPTLVWRAELDEPVRRAIEVNAIAALERMRQELPPLGAGQGWQSTHNLHELAEFSELIASVRHLAAGVLRFLRLGQPDVEITGCWATVLAPGAAHKLHTHPNNFLSGVYYLRIPAGADTINFHDPRSQTAILRPPVVELTAQSTDQVVVRVRDGTLLMFPAWLPHSVDQNGSGCERTSVSFNIMFGSFAEVLAKPLWSPRGEGDA